MKKRILIEVTKNDIKNGITHDCEYCPVARALNNNNILTTFDQLFLSKNCPRSVHRFVARFDSGKLVKPFKFYINL